MIDAAWLFVIVIVGILAIAGILSITSFFMALPEIRQEIRNYLIARGWIK